MAAGMPQQLRVEVDFVTGTPTDITSYVAYESANVKVAQGRSTQFDDWQPGTCELVLRNDDGRFTPDNPLSPYFPNVVERKAMRVILRFGGTDYTRFTGFVDDWAPSWPSSGIESAVVAVRGSDLLARINQATLYSDYAEQGILRGVIGGVFSDCWLFDDSGGVSGYTPRNVGMLGPAKPAKLLTTGPAGARGGINVGYEALTQDGSEEYLIVDGGVSFRAPSVAQGSNAGWVMQCPFGGAPKGWSIFLRIPQRASMTITYVVGGAYNAAGDCVFEMRLVDNGGTTDLNLFNGDTASATFLGTLILGVRETFWYELSTADVGSGITNFYNAGTLIGGFTCNGALTTVATQHWGGRLRPRAGKVSQASTMVISTFSAWGGTAYTSPWAYAVPGDGGIVNSNDRLTDYTAYATNRGIIGGVNDFVSNGTSEMKVKRTPTKGRTLGDCLTELGRSIGGVLWVTRLGKLSIMYGNATKPASPYITVAIEADADGPPEMIRSVTDIPTRVTVTTPDGTTTVKDAAAEALGARREVSITTASATVDQGATAGSALLYRSKGLRLKRVKVDLANAENNLYATVFGTTIPARIVRVTELPSAQLGKTYIDGYWAMMTEEYGSVSASLVYDLDPVLPMGHLDTDRFTSAGSTVTGGTALSNGTTTGTIVVVTSVGPAWTVNAGQYPMVLDWNGEHIMVTTPGSSGSPQTFNVIQRGVAPTVARVHAAGEMIDVRDKFVFR